METNNRFCLSFSKMSLQEAGLPLSVCIQCKLSLRHTQWTKDKFCEPILAKATWHAERCDSANEETLKKV